MPSVRSLPRRQLFRSRTCLGLNDKYVGVIRAVGILVLVADKRDPLPIRRPLGLALIYVLAVGQLLHLLGREIPQVELVVIFIAQIALDVLLEVIAIDHDRLRRRRRLAFLLIRLLFWVQCQQQLLRILRPAIALDLLVGDV